MVQRIRGYVGVAYSHIRTLLNIIGWGGMMTSFLIGLLFGFVVGYQLGLSGFFESLPPCPPVSPA